MDVTEPARSGPDAATSDSWGQRLRLFRRSHLGLSRGDFAELINDRARRDALNVACSERHVARWELGEVRKPSKIYRTLLTGLGAPVPETGALLPPATGRGREASRPPETRTLRGGSGADPSLLEALASAVVGSPDILTPWLPALEEPRIGCGTADLDLAAVRDATAGLRELDQRHGGGAVARPALELLRSARVLLARQRGHKLAHPLLVAAADVARLLGWVYHDIGDQHRARRFAVLALDSARRAGADSLVASTLYVLGRISLLERNPRVALRVFQLGQLPAQDAADGGESARLYANEAWAHAMMGDHARMRTALARAEAGIAEAGEGVDPWARVFVSPGEFAGMRSVIFNEYALTTRGPAADHYTAAAVDSARDSLRAAAPGRPARSILFDNITIATGMFRLGEIEDALPYARTALELTAQVDSGRVGERLRTMAHAAAPASGRSDVRDMRRQVRAATSRDRSHPDVLSNVIVAENI
ncbi:hypothetical protein [Nocardia sp. NPDC048505]|uniref:hypothetical protein n=1 Tax=unclassified Nocardia TaxID=2637762 RepID=UPI0033DBB086